MGVVRPSHNDEARAVARPVQQVKAVHAPLVCTALRPCLPVVWGCRRQVTLAVAHLRDVRASRVYGFCPVLSTFYGFHRRRSRAMRCVSPRMRRPRRPATLLPPPMRPPASAQVRPRIQLRRAAFAWLMHRECRCHALSSHASQRVRLSAALDDTCGLNSPGQDFFRSAARTEDSHAGGDPVGAEAEPQVALRAAPAGARRWGPAQFAPAAPSLAAPAAPGEHSLFLSRQGMPLSCCHSQQMLWQHDTLVQGPLDAPVYAGDLVIYHLKCV